MKDVVNFDSSPGVPNLNEILIASQQSHSQLLSKLDEGNFVRTRSLVLYVLWTALVGENWSHVVAQCYGKHYVSDHVVLLTAPKLSPLE